MGEGQVVLLSGEAGIGKSRLTQVLKERIAGEPHTRVECRCSPFYQNSALYPLIEHLQRLLQFRRDDPPEEKLRKLEVGARHAVPLQQETVPLLASLLSIPLSGRYPPLTLTPQKQKQKTLETLITWLLKEAERQPVRLDIEDLHWADPSTLEFLTLLIDQVPTVRLLTVLTFRPEFHPPWGMRSHIAQVSLNRLARRQIEAMVEKVAGGRALPPEIVRQVAAKTDGVPLFVEELTKMVLESGLHVGAQHAAPLPLGIPTTLHDALMSRLDRLGTTKEVAQLGATLGREFSYELLRAVSLLDEDTLRKSLAQLVDVELVYQRGLPPQARYIFKHALIQDAAYQSLLKSRRQQLHQRIAQVLEEQFAETKETQPELLAHHYTEAGLTEQAIPYWQGAGQRAIERSANSEAISHLTRGLELLKTLPDTPERTQQELMLQIALGVPLQATQGYAVPEVERVYTRALELCQQVGETPQLFPVLSGLWLFNLARAELQTAHKLAEQLLRLAQSVQDPAFLVEAHRALGVTLWHLGELASAQKHLEHSIALYGPQQHRSLAFLYVIDPRMFCRSFVALTLWLRGYPDQALKKIRESLTSARELSHPYSQGYALDGAAWIHRFRREQQATQEQAEALEALSNEQGFALLLAEGTMFRGWALIEQGQREEGIEQIRQGLAALHAGGLEVVRPYFLALLAESCGKVGQLKEGLKLLDEALTAAHKNAGCFYEAELYRLKGQLTLQSKTSLGQVSGKSQTSRDKSEDTSTQHPTPSTQAEAEAEACFLKAINIARRQQAKSLELRATTSLARLWQQQGKKADARQMLAEVYEWFTEGFDTADLKEAKALLEELKE